jgi:hypothetical protein
MTLHLSCLGRVAPVVHDRILTSLRTIGTQVLVAGKNEVNHSPFFSFAIVGCCSSCGGLRERDAVDFDIEPSGPLGHNDEDARWELSGEVAAVHLVGGPEHVGA